MSGWLTDHAANSVRFWKHVNVVPLNPLDVFFYIIVPIGICMMGSNHVKSPDSRHIQRTANSGQQFGVLTLGFQSSHMESMLPALPEPWFHHGNNCGIKVELPQCIYIYVYTYIYIYIHTHTYIIYIYISLLS